MTINEDRLPDGMSIRFARVMNEYYRKFEDYFPTEHFMTASESDMIDKMRECIKQNKQAKEVYPEIADKEKLY